LLIWQNKMPDLMRKCKSPSGFFPDGGIYYDAASRYALYAQQCALVAFDLAVYDIKPNLAGDIGQTPASIYAKATEKGIGHH
jgi:hypothetical protein